MNLSLTVDGSLEAYRLFCVEGDQARGVDLSGTRMTLNYGVGGSLRLSTSPSGASGDWSYFSFLGKTLSWTVDLSNVPCGLNATFYSVHLSQGQGYHDACSTFFTTTELDFMEANQYAWHTTLHRASHDCGSAPPIGYGGTISDPRYLFKDLGGSTTTPTHLLYGPGTAYTINTLLPFQASLSFEVNAQEELETVALTLSQGDHAIGQQYDAHNEEYKGWLAALGKEMVSQKTQGNVLVWSLWTGGLNWLESPPCPGTSPHCTSTSCQYTISDISL